MGNNCTQLARQRKALYRPHKKPGERFEWQISTNLQSEQYTSFIKLVARSGLTEAEYLRTLVNHAIKRRVI